MAKQKKDDLFLIKTLQQAIAHSPEALNQFAHLIDQYVIAAKNLAEDEMALIEAYLKRDLQEFGTQYQHQDQAVFNRLIADSIWEQLAEITDKTQLEWHEVLRDIQHHGIYHAGELVGLGILRCEKCGYQTEHNCVALLTPCFKCGGKQFSRKALPV